EDGIRDFHVTGVQTCALPILSNFINFYQILSKLHLCVACFLRLYCSISRGEHKRKKMATKFKALVGFTRMKDDELMVTAATVIEIGRASCRERVKIAMVAVAV